MIKTREQDQERRRRIRGWILYILYEWRPKPLEMHSLMRLLDRRNMPLSRELLGAEVDHLRSLELVRVFPSQATTELSEVEQARWVQIYVDADSDTQMNDALMVRISRYGVAFHEGDRNVDGIERVA